VSQVCEGALNIHQLWGSMLEFVAINLWFLVNGAVPVKYGVIATGMCLLALSWVAWISILVKRARSAVASLESKQTAAFVEYIANVRTFRLNGWDAFVQRKLDRMTDEMRPLRLRAIRLKMLNIVTSFTLSPVICVVIAIWSGAVNGKLSPSLARSIFDVFDLNKCASNPPSVNSMQHLTHTLPD
jgi:ABC-type multidrug transport system fused ATPase/permease subunit